LRSCSLYIQPAAQTCSTFQNILCFSPCIWKYTISPGCAPTVAAHNLQILITFPCSLRFRISVYTQWFVDRLQHAIIHRKIKRLEGNSMHIVRFEGFLFQIVIYNIFYNL
jgi:hypothetical protein